jgi:hypothetical protein
VGSEVRLVDDITILQEMLSTGAQVPLQQTHGKPSVTLKDKQGKTTVEIINLPDNSIVIKPEYFKPPNAFKGSKGERRRADFAIVSNKDAEKWIICIETQKGTGKDSEDIEQQLRGAECFIGYCKCIGKSFWQSAKFLDDYKYRFISISGINIDKQSTRFYKPRNQSARRFHDTPDTFREFFDRQSLYFEELT